MLTFEVAIRRLARSARMSHDGQRRVALHDRPDIRLHPMSITVIVYFPADIREESIYPRLSTLPSRHAVARWRALRLDLPSSRVAPAYGRLRAHGPAGRMMKPLAIAIENYAVARVLLTSGVWLCWCGHA